MATRRKDASPEREAYLALVETCGRLQDEFARLFRAHGLTPASFNVLRILRGARPDGLSCGEIGTRMVQRVPDVTRLVDGLVRRGLAERARCSEDRRRVIVAIARPGLEALAALDRPVDALHRAQLGHLPRGKLRELTALLRAAGRRPG